MKRHVLITGCSSAGKSTLLEALAASGYQVVREPGRRIIAKSRTSDAEALPWINPRSFAQTALAMAIDDLRHAPCDLVFFDRGTVDAASALEVADGIPLHQSLKSVDRYGEPVFVTPPWPEVFQNNADRRHDFQTAVEEYHRITLALDQLGYACRILPFTGVNSRVAFVLDELGL